VGEYAKIRGGNLVAFFVRRPIRRRNPPTSIDFTSFHIVSRGCLVLCAFWRVCIVRIRW
jgi:hypothetical protein